MSRVIRTVSDIPVLPTSQASAGSGTLVVKAHRIAIAPPPYHRGMTHADKQSTGDLT